MGSDLIESRQSSRRNGEGPGPSAASKAGRGTHPTSGGGVSAPVSEPGRFTPIHLWLALERPDRNIRASSGRSSEHETLVGAPRPRHRTEAYARARPLPAAIPA